MHDPNRELTQKEKLEYELAEVKMNLRYQGAPDHAVERLNKRLMEIEEELKNIE